MTPPSRAVSEFLDEASEILDALGTDLHALEERREAEVDPGLLNAIFRSAHSLKGLGGMFGQPRIAAVAHQLEELLDRLRLGQVSLTEGVLDALGATLDVLHALVAEASREESSEALGARAAALGVQLEALAAAAPTEVEEDLLAGIGLDERVRAVLTEYEEHRLRDNLRRGRVLWKVRAAFDLSDFDARLGEVNLRLRPLGEVVSTLPSAQPAEGADIAFDLLFASDRGEAELQAALAGTGATLAPIEPAPPEPVRAAPAGSLRSLTQTVRVDIGRLDGLMNAVGELLLTRANLQRLVDGVRQGGPQAVSKLWLQELQRETRQLERRLEELQKGILDVRMVPLGQIFDKLSRLVRRIARDFGKELELVVTGGDVELDKLIVEALSDPLMHIIHNAIDHGVQPPEVRARAGKNRRATVGLRAEQHGSQVVIEVSDDGPGIDEARVRALAIQKGLLGAEEAAALTRRELHNLVFLPGFSTATEVSDLSGRGVGLDVVKTNIANLSGTIDLHSTPGEGTTFRLTLPLTLAIVRALVVMTSGRSYAVPLNSVLEILSVRPDEILTTERRETVSLRGQPIPFVRLARLFGHPESPVDRHYVVVVGLGQERLGIAVDALLGQQDIVTKPLGGRLRNVRGISGATELGDRRVVLVLDVGALADEVLGSTKRVG